MDLWSNLCRFCLTQRLLARLGCWRLDLEGWPRFIRSDPLFSAAATAYDCALYICGYGDYLIHVPSSCDSLAVVDRLLIASLCPTVAKHGVYAVVLWVFFVLDDGGEWGECHDVSRIHHLRNRFGSRLFIPEIFA